MSRKSCSFIRPRSSAFLAAFHLASRRAASALKGAKTFFTTWSCKTATAPTQERTTAARYCLVSKHTIASSMKCRVSVFTIFISCALSEEATCGTGDPIRGPAIVATCWLPADVSSQPSTVRTAKLLLLARITEMFFFRAERQPEDSASSLIFLTSLGPTGCTARQMSVLS